MAGFKSFSLLEESRVSKVCEISFEIEVNARSESAASAIIISFQRHLNTPLPLAPWPHLIRLTHSARASECYLNKFVSPSISDDSREHLVFRDSKLPKCFRVVFALAISESICFPRLDCSLAVRPCADLFESDAFLHFLSPPSSPPRFLFSFSPPFSILSIISFV